MASNSKLSAQNWMRFKLLIQGEFGSLLADKSTGLVKANRVKWLALAVCLFLNFCLAAEEFILPMFLRTFIQDCKAAEGTAYTVSNIG